MPVPAPILQRLQLFDRLPPDQLQRFAALLAVDRVDRRGVVVKRGDALPRLGFVVEGRLQSVTFTMDGKEVGTDFIEPGDFFGELSVIDGKPAPEYVIAVAPSRLVFMDRTLAHGLMFATPASAQAVAQRLAERLRRAASHRALLALPSSFQRVCAQLLLLAQQSQDGALVIHAPPTHQEIAIMVNTSRETVTRTLQFLQSQRVVQRAERHLRVEQPQVLQAAADGKVSPTTTPPAGAPKAGAG